jgi:hypothetical protein
MKLHTLMASVVCVGGSTLVHNTSPIGRIVTLIVELKAGIEADGKKEQQEYDKYACWCEKTLARKASAITDGKATIEKMQNLIEKLRGELAAHGAEIAQLTKDVEENKKEQAEATEVRNKENEEFESTKGQNEQCTGALEAAIKVLTGAGSGKGFLQTMHEAQLLSVVGGVRDVLSKPLVTDELSESDVDVIRKFVEHPQAFMDSHGAVSQMQVSNANPFGDYAPKSTQIQGILKGMYDAFTSDIEKNNAEEAESQKAFEELMATKTQELETLELTLETHTTDEAEKNKQLAESTTTRDDTQKQVKADEQFFEDAKQGCKAKAKEWSERSRLRTEELTGINKGLEILTSPEAQSTFAASSSTMLLQLHSRTRATRSSAFEKLRKLAAKYGNSAMAKLASKLKSGGHFDKIMVMIDEMVADLRKEEAEDIAHRDRCENQGNANKNMIEDLENEIQKHGDSITRMEDKETELKATIESLEGEQSSTKDDMEELLSMRNDEVAAFKQALKDDADAVHVISQAIVVMAKFYKENKIPLQLVQVNEPEYSVDPDKAPETSFHKSDRSRESGGIIAILEMVKEDTEKEMKESIADDKANQAEYEKNRGALKKTLDAQTASKVELEKELADLEQKMQDTHEAKEGKINDLSEAQALEGTLGKDCAWVKTHFDSRREKRKAEIEGLQEAKNFLAGAGIDAEDDLD